MPSSSSSSSGPLVCPRCAISYPLDERFCTQCGMPLVYAGSPAEDPATESQRRARKVKPQYSRGEPVKVGFARNQAEAELIQGLLLEEGIPSFLKRTRGFDVPDFLAAGPRDILVPQAAAEAARLALATTEIEGEAGERDELRRAAEIGAIGSDTSPGRLLAWILVGVAAAAGIVWALYQVTG
jgi:hypothetical protein